MVVESSNDPTGSPDEMCVHITAIYHARLLSRMYQLNVTHVCAVQHSSFGTTEGGFDHNGAVSRQISLNSACN